MDEIGKDLRTLAWARAIEKDPEQVKKPSAEDLKIFVEAEAIRRDPKRIKQIKELAKEKLHERERDKKEAKTLPPEIKAKNEPGKLDSMAGSRPEPGPKIAPDADLPEVVSEIENPAKLERAASPQAEDGHVDIANELVEAFQRVNFSAYEWRVLWAILRESYGWHRKMAPISLTDFQKMTRMDRRNISRTLSKLVRRRIVRKVIVNKKKFRRYSGDSDNTNSVTYGLQKDYLKWRSNGYSDTPVSIQTTKRGAIQTIDVDRKPLSTNGHRTPKESKEIKHYVADSNEWRLSNLLLDEILKNKPNLKKPNLQAWARDIDLLLRVDKRSVDEVERVIRWATADHTPGPRNWKGWAAVILSAGSLREKFDKIEMRMKEPELSPQVRGPKYDKVN